MHLYCRKQQQHLVYAHVRVYTQDVCSDGVISVHHIALHSTMQYYANLLLQEVQPADGQVQHPVGNVSFPADIPSP